MFRNEKHSVSVSSITLQRKFKRVDPSTAIGGQGDTLLHTILAQKHLSVEDRKKVDEFISENTFLLTERNSEGNTPIHIAAEFSHNDVITTGFSQIDLYPVIRQVRLLNVIEKNKQGKNPLHLAVENKHMINVNNRHMESLQVLIKHFGELINIQDNEGRTPLHIAVLVYTKDPKDPSHSIDYYNIVEKLLNVRNIDTEVTDNEGKSVYDYVSGCKDKELIDLFIKHYRKKKGDTELELKNCSEEAQIKENLSKKSNRAAIVSTVIADITNCLHEYPQAHLARASGIIKLSAVAPYSSLFLLIALACHNRSSSCKKKCYQLEEDIEQYRTKISELEGISKDIKHNEAITKLEESLQKSKEEIKKLSEIENKFIADSLSDIKSLLEESCSIKQATVPHVEGKGGFRPRTSSCGARFNGRPPTIVRSPKSSIMKKDIEHNEAIAKLKNDLPDNKKELKVLSKIEDKFAVSLSDIKSLLEEECRIKQTTLPIVEEVEKKGGFRHRTSSCGAYFNEKPSTTLQSPKPSIVKKDVSCGRS